MDGQLQRSVPSADLPLGQAIGSPPPFWRHHSPGGPRTAPLARPGGGVLEASRRARSAPAPSFASVSGYGHG